jgi:hypothetical protein
MAEANEHQAASSSVNANNGAANHERLPSLPRAADLPRSHEAALVDTLSRALGMADQVKLAGLTRAINSFNGFLTSVCGRKADEMTAADVTRLATILKAYDDLEVDRNPRRH